MDSVQLCTSTPEEPTTPKFSPPYKRMRALKLFNDANQNLKQNRSLLSHSKLASPIEKSSNDTTARHSLHVPPVNQNPFSPEYVSVRKRTHSSGFGGSTEHLSFAQSTQIEDDVDDSSCLNGSRRSLRDSNIVRCYQEFDDLQCIGIGQFASVYKCMNRLDGCEYAIKRSKETVTHGIREKMAMNEVFAHAVLCNHRNVVRYFSAWVEDDHMIIQNEYCNGGSLEDRIKNKQFFGADDLKNLLRHIAEGLRYIHSEGLVHMDIKPSNIFIANSNRHTHLDVSAGLDGVSLDESLDDEAMSESDCGVVYKIGDLGHVTSIRDRRVEEGDCRYLALEILRDDYAHLPEADIFALGISALEAAGLTPLPKNGDAWHELRSGGSLPKLPNPLPTELAELLRLMIQPDVTKRPTARHLLHHRALHPDGGKSRAQLHRELNALKLKNEILSKQLIAASQCIQKLAPSNSVDSKRAGKNKRLVGGKKSVANRSTSLTQF